MKRILSAYTILLFFAPAWSQTIFIANSNPAAVGGTNVFLNSSALFDAVDAASDGDIIYVVPSNVKYDPVSLNGKKVSLIGGGFNPDKPGGPMTTVDYIFSVASDIRISGLVVTNQIHIVGSVSNIIIEKCRIGSITQSPGSVAANLIIEKCIIGENNSGFTVFLQNESSNVIISNNILYASSAPIFENCNAATIRNNLLVAGSGTYAFGTMKNCNIQNNIFYTVSVNPQGTFTDNDQVNNLTTATSAEPFFNTANGNTSTDNLEDVEDPMFRNFLGTQNYDFSYDLTLQSGSPAIGSGLGGIDMGVFGGPNPFDVHGTSLPLIQNIIAPMTSPQGVNMNVRIQAKGN